MADGVLDLSGHLSAGEVTGLSIRHEHRIVTEPVLPARLGDDPPLHRGDLGDLGAIRVDERHRTHEPTTTTLVGKVEGLVEQQLEVARVGRLASRPACRTDARHPIEGVNLETGIVGQRRQIGVMGSSSGLDEGVLDEGGAGLLGSRSITDLRQTDDLDVSPGRLEGTPQFDQFLGIVGRQHNPAHSVTPRASDCAALSEAQPPAARSSRSLRRPRLKGAPSAVPWISTKSPSPLMTTFMSVSARESSS